MQKSHPIYGFSPRIWNLRYLSHGRLTSEVPALKIQPWLQDQYSFGAVILPPLILAPWARDMGVGELMQALKISFWKVGLRASWSVRW